MKKLILLILFTTISYGQVDSIYYFNSQKIIEHYPKSRITAEDLFEIASEVNDSLGIIVPYELALSQAVIETSLGSSGVGKSKNNPYSINSSKGYRKYSTMKEGIRVYYYLIAKRYLKYRTKEQLLQNFVNRSKNRYASDSNYELKLRKQIKFFQKLLNK